MMSNEVKITSFVVKVVSRCNINCDYCYVYKHVDQSYKKQPLRLNKAHITLFARRIDEYISQSGIEIMRICLHGGEPLLAGLNYLENFFITLHQNIQNINKVRFAIQTNGVLITKEILDLFRKYNVGVSLSLDGPRSANDKHRLDHKGLSTYEKVFNAIQMLKTEYSDLFLGIISVIDPTNDPREIIDFFAAIDPPSYDLLFPDANHFVHPPLRLEQPKIYEDWIRQTLHYWYRNQPELRLRMFRNVVGAVVGYPTESEFFGNGDVGYLILETDGSYHYSDLLKATYEGASHTGLHVESAGIADVLKAQAIEGFRSNLFIENKCDTCLKCPELNICGSGQIAHRYGPKGFDHPTTYCRETLTMIREARHLVAKDNANHLSTDVHQFCQDIMRTLFSDQALYLIGALTQQEVPADIEWNQEPTTESLNYLQKAFGNFSHEIKLVLPSANIENEPEIILEQFIAAKFAIIQKYLPLTSSDTSFEGLKLVYSLAYSYRYWQTATDWTEQAYFRASERKETFLKAINSLEFTALSPLGQTFFATLIDEFLPGQIVYKGNCYVYC